MEYVQSEVHMGRGGKQIEGQLSFDFCLDSRNYVCQHNKLISGIQTLKLNSAKLVRAAIMQVVKEDMEFKPYVITVAELAELLNVSKSNLYRDINSITDDIINNPVKLQENDGKKIRWIKIPWVKRCEYNSDIGVAIKLNDELKPYLIELKKNYTQYTLDSILGMKSVYTLRLFELLQSKIYTYTLPKEGIDIEFSVESMKEMLGCNISTYDSFSNFRSRIIDTAVKEINDKTLYYVTFQYKKSGKAVTDIIFNVNTYYHVKLINKK